MAVSTFAARVPAALRSRKVVDKVGTMLAVRVASMGVTKQLDLARPTTVQWLRWAFVIVHVAAILVFLYITKLIRKRNDRTAIKVKPARTIAKAKAIVLQTVTGQEQPRDPKDYELLDTTVEDYDLKEAKAAITSIARSVVLMGAVSLFLGWNKMLIAPVISRPVATARHALVQLYLMGKAPVGSLAREATPEEVAEAEKAKLEAKAVPNGNGKVPVPILVEKSTVEETNEKASLIEEVVEVMPVAGGEDVGVKLRQRRVEPAL